MNFLSRLFRPLTRTLRGLRIPRMLTLTYYWSLLTAPLAWIFGRWKSRRFRDLLMGMPALLGLAVVILLAGSAQVQQRSLSLEYFNAASAALKRDDYAQARLLLNRVIKRGDAKTSDAQYAMAVLLEEIGQKERATELFSVLAPDFSHGNAAAHRRVAILLAESLTPDSPPEDIKRVYWHLTTAADDHSPQLAMAWGRYCLATQDIQSAKKHFKVAVNEFPELWQTLAAMEMQDGNSGVAVSYFERAAEYLAERVRTNPENHRDRVEYATVLMKLGHLDNARVILEQGQLIDPDGPWPWLLGSLAVNYHDLKASENRPVSELLSYLDRALTYEPNHGAALHRLMSYATAKATGNVELRSVLERVVAEAEQPVLAHIALGNLCWIEGDSDAARFHFETAMRHRSDVGPLLNNLAWLIAHDTRNPDPERAMALINTALKLRPDDANFLDTRGTIFILKKNWTSALTDLEKAISQVDDKSAIHRKLATVYTELGKDGIAQEHLKLAERN